MEHIEQYIEDEGVVISDDDLQPHQVRFTIHMQPGFIGICKYNLRGADEEVQGTEETGETSLTTRQQIWLLAQLAFY